MLYPLPSCLSISGENPKLRVGRRHSGIVPSLGPPS
jgi:hypothetical protein